MKFTDTLRQLFNSTPAPRHPRSENHPAKLGGRTEFAVVDVETTGLFPAQHDRIVEIAIVRMTWAGQIVDQYATLVNPGRDVGPTSIHGIRAQDVTPAPPFGEIAGDVIDRLSGAVVVGHNVDFDLRFLASEISRVGSELPDVLCVCTLSLARSIVPPPDNARLSSCCRALGIQHDDAHTALSDARATAKVLMAIIAATRCADLRALGCAGGSLLQRGNYTHLVRSGKTLTRMAATALAESTQTYLSRLVAALPLSPEVFKATQESKQSLLSYLDLLDRALEDRHISPAEAEGLVGLAREWGMSADVVKQAHAEYLRGLARAAVADGVVSKAEREDLAVVSKWLGLGESELGEALRSAREAPATGAIPDQSPDLALKGQSVCFTGEMTCTIRGELISREMAEALAAAKGLVVKGNVSKKLDLLVTADPLSQSGKSRKAREYGLRIMAERLFWRTLDVQVD